MQSDSNTFTQRNAQSNPSDSSVDSSITAFATETKHDAKGVGDSSFNNDKPLSPDVSMQSSSVEGSDLSHDQRNAGTVEQISPFLPADSSEMDSRANKVIDDLGRYQNSRAHHPSLLLEDLKKLGMAGELSEDNKFATTSFVHRLVTTMKMAELILNDTVQSERKARIEQIKLQLDAKHCPNMDALLREMDKARHDLTQKHSFQSMGFFEPGMLSLEGFILFETMMIAKGIDWLAHLSITPDLETRRATLSVFSELQAAYSSERTLHELYFHQHRVAPKPSSKWSRL